MPRSPQGRVARLLGIDVSDLEQRLTDGRLRLRLLPARAADGDGNGARASASVTLTSVGQQAAWPVAAREGLHRR